MTVASGLRPHTGQIFQDVGCFLAINNFKYYKIQIRRELI